jgi:predicted MFS family arabinose efflux permease
VVGLLLGGALTDLLDWRWVLFVNVPIALIVLAGSRVLPSGERDLGRVDVPGAITATAGVGALVYAINRASTVGWTDGSTIGFLLAAIGLLTAFVLIQRRSPVAMLPPRLLRDRGRVGAFAIIFLIGVGLFSTLYFLTLYLQRVEGYSPMETGLAFLPIAIGMGVGGGVIGPRLLAKFDERTITAVAMLTAAAAMAWFSMLSPGTNAFAILLPAQLVAGVGLGITMVTSTVRTLRDISPNDTGVASGLLNTSQQLGGALGLAVLAAIATANGSSAGYLSAGLVFVLAMVIALASYRRRTH